MFVGVSWGQTSASSERETNTFGASVALLELIYNQMKWTSSAFFASLSLASRASAFSAPKAFLPRRHFASSSSLNASVLKLSDPQKELLDNVDVFIFDCDGVIWRVSNDL